MFTPFCFLILVIVCHIIYFFGWYERVMGSFFFTKDEIDTKERERDNKICVRQLLNQHYKASDVKYFKHT